MDQKVSCLYRLDGKTGNQVIRLDDQEKVTLGRHDDNDYVLEESPTISRFHVEISKHRDGWTIKDLGSSNGVFVNGVRIKDGHQLNNSDKVEIGKDPKKANDPAVYRYQFYKQAKLKKRAAPDPAEPGPSKLPKDVPRLRRIVDESTMTASLLREKMREQEERLQQEYGEELKQLKQKLELKEQEQERKEKEQEKQKADELKELREKIELQEKEKAELEERIEKQKAVEAAFEERQLELKKKVEEHNELQQKMEAQCAEISAQLNAKQQEQAEAEKAREELERELRDKMKTEEEKQAAEARIEDLSKMLNDHETQTKDLQNQLGSLKTEVDEGKKRHQAAKEEWSTSVEDAMEDELVCAICAEFFVQATSLNCSHSFCKLCIQKWMRRKKECPNCRKSIESSVQSLVLDNYINKAVAFLSQELQHRRKALIDERKEEQRQFDEEIANEVIVLDEVPLVANEVTINADAAANRIQQTGQPVVNLTNILQQHNNTRPQQQPGQRPPAGPTYTQPAQRANGTNPRFDLNRALGRPQQANNTRPPPAHNNVRGQHQGNNYARPQLAHNNQVNNTRPQPAQNNQANSARPQHVVGRQPTGAQNPHFVQAMPDGTYQVRHAGPLNMELVQQQIRQHQQQAQQQQHRQQQQRQQQQRQQQQRQHLQAAAERAAAAERERQRLVQHTQTVHQQLQQQRQQQQQRRQQATAARRGRR